MKLAVITLGALGLVALSSGHAAADISGLQYRLTDSAAEVVVLSDHALGNPRVSTSRGEVKVWFPDADDNARIHTAGDGQAIVRARLRPGVKTSAVLDIDVGGRRHVDASQVMIETNAGGTLVRIPRSELQTVKAEPAPATPTASAAAARNVDRTDTTVADSAAASIHDVTTTEPVSGAIGVLGTKPAKAPTAAKTRAGEPKSKTAAAPLASGGESKVQTLVLISLLLAAVLAGIKFWQRKTTAFLREPDIEVVAAKRLGPGLQLFIVRAFGREHLLSVNGKSTERIATKESFTDALATAGGDAARPGFSLPNEPGMQLIPSRSVLDPSTAPKRSPGGDETPLVDLPLPRPRLNTAQSIAGLIRLREQLDRAN